MAAAVLDTLCRDGARRCALCSPPVGVSEQAQMRAARYRHNEKRAILAPVDPNLSGCVAGTVLTGPCGCSVHTLRYRESKPRSVAISVANWGSPARRRRLARRAQYPFLFGQGVWRQRADHPKMYV